MKYAQFISYGKQEWFLGDDINDPIVKEVKDYLDSIFEDYKLEMTRGLPVTKFNDFYTGTLTISKWGHSQAFLNMPAIVREKLNKMSIEHCIYTHNGHQEYFEIHTGFSSSVRAERFADCFKEVIQVFIDQLKMKEKVVSESVAWFEKKLETLESSGKTTVVEYEEFI